MSQKFKKILAKEILWFVGTFFTILAVATIITFIFFPDEDIYTNLIWGVSVWTLIFNGIRYFFILLRWAYRTARS